MVTVCFVCLGNICRSPTAEGVMAWLIEREGLAGRIRVDSAGTGAWHVGEPPDPRATAAARRRGIRLFGAARQFQALDFGRFDLVVAMDQSNLRNLQHLAPGPAETRKLSLLRDFDPKSPPGSGVPDPYYGGPDGFEEVLDQCEAACRGLIAHLRQRHGV